MRFDFVEIGTSDFETLASQEGGMGLSVEPVRWAYDKLPSGPNRIRVYAAIGEAHNTGRVWFIHPSRIEALDLPDWVRGCVMVNRKHPTVETLLAQRGIESDTVWSSKPVGILTVTELYQRHSVTEVGYFKVDCEGDDPKVIRSMVAAGDELGVWPEIVEWEANSLTSEIETEATIGLLNDRGYETEQWDRDKVICSRVPVPA
jgi:hypothetical protein